MNQAVIFDMDGVIFDSERCVVECWQEVAKKHGIPEIEKACVACLGTTKAKTTEIMHEIYGQDFPYAEYNAEERAIFMERYDNGRLPVKNGARELLAALKEHGARVALASSTRREMVTRELRDAGLLEYFDELICGDMVTHSKPDPEIYLLACKALNVTPGEAYAIEDSPNGVRSANAAGMKVLMVPDLAPVTEELREKSYRVLQDLFEVGKLFGIM